MAWGAGYAPKGSMCGRFAIPITLHAYPGRSVKGERPTLTFPNGFDPHSVFFAAERMQEGDPKLLIFQSRALAMTP